MHTVVGRWWCVWRVQGLTLGVRGAASTPTVPTNLVITPLRPTRFCSMPTPKRTQTTLMALLAMILVVYLFAQTSNLDSPDEHPLTAGRGATTNHPPAGDKTANLMMPKAEREVTMQNLEDEPFMPRMENATLKAELGRASWKLFHTILARYPLVPSPSQRQITHDYLLLFAQVYPCGDCARHFNKLITTYPPQLSNRNTASVWGCDLHNKVNKRLGKDIYDCSYILEDYDCGCGGDEAADAAEAKAHLSNVELNVEEKQLG